MGAHGSKYAFETIPIGCVSAADPKSRKPDVSAATLEACMKAALDKTGGARGTPFPYACILTQWADTSHTAIQAWAYESSGDPNQDLQRNGWRSDAQCGLGGSGNDFVGDSGSGSYGLYFGYITDAPFKVVSAEYRNAKGDVSANIPPQTVQNLLQDNKWTVDPGQLFSAGNPKPFAGPGVLYLNVTNDNGGWFPKFAGDGQQLDIGIRDASGLATAGSPFPDGGFARVANMPDVLTTSMGTEAKIAYYSKRYAQVLNLLQMADNASTIGTLKSAAMTINGTLQNLFAQLLDEQTKGKQNVATLDKRIANEITELQKELDHFKRMSDTRDAVKRIIAMRQKSLDGVQMAYDLFLGALAAGALGMLIMSLL